MADLSYSPLQPCALLFSQPSSEVSTGLANVHFTTSTRNSIDPCLTARVMLVFMGVKLRFNLLQVR